MSEDKPINPLANISFAQSHHRFLTERAAETNRKMPELFHDYLQLYGQDESLSKQATPLRIGQIFGQDLKRVHQIARAMGRSPEEVVFIIMLLAKANYRASQAQKQTNPDDVDNT